MKAHRKFRVGGNNNSFFTSAVVVITCALSAIFLNPAGANAQTGQVDRLGINVGYELANLSDAQLDTTFAKIQSTGLRWVRMPAHWDWIEYGPNKYDWSGPDRISAALKRHNLSPIVVFQGVPTWYRGNQADVADFANSLAKRYATGGGVIEMSNEPNLPGGSSTTYSISSGPAPDINTYVETIKTAYTAIKKAAPAATVMIGGLADPYDNLPMYLSAVTFLQKIYDLGGKGYFDAVGMHPYTYPNTATDPGTRPVDNVFAAHDLMVSKGDGGKKIWITEYGAPTGTSSSAVTEQRQADIISTGVSATRGVDFLGPVLLYSLYDAGNDKSDKEDNFGLLRTDGSAKPAFAALQNAMAGG